MAGFSFARVQAQTAAEMVTRLPWSPFHGAYDVLGNRPSCGVLAAALVTRVGGATSCFRDEEAIPRAGK